MTQQPLGALVIDELIVPLTSVRLRGGRFELEAELVGPVRAVDSDRWHVNGQDAHQVMAADHHGNRLTWGAIDPGDRLTVVLPVRIPTLAPAEAGCAP